MNCACGCPLSRFIPKLITSVLGVGYLPFIPGTFGSMVGLYLVWQLRYDPVFYIVNFLTIVVLGFMFSDEVEQSSGRKDPPYIVIDEVAGMMLSMMFLPVYDIRIMFCGFLLFRILDTVKIFPANSLQNKHGSLGIMSDDLVAGLYANILLQIITRVAL